MTSYYIPLQKNYNTKFSTSLNGHAVYFEIRTAKGMMFVSISVDGEFAVAGKKAVKGASLLPGRFRKVVGGVVYFGGTDVGYPDPESLDNISTTLVYEQD